MARYIAFSRSARKLFRVLSWCALLALVSSETAAQNSIVLVGTGSSVPAPLYNEWADQFNRQSYSVKVRYLTVGTDESIDRILNGSGDFGGGDRTISEAELKGSKTALLELPMVVIGIVAVYNLPNLNAELNLTAPTLANIFLGKVQNWSDPRILKFNPGVRLPNLPISVIHRTPGKGSSLIFSEYLSKVSPEFQAKVGRSTSPRWPVGRAAERSEDLIELVKTVPGAIGYAELNWTEKSGLAMARIRNPGGEFVKATPKSLATAAAASEGKLTADFRVSLTNGGGANSYPITSYTWLYVPMKPADAVRAQALVTFLKWALSTGQEIATARGYVALPSEVLSRVQSKLASIK